MKVCHGRHVMQSSNALIANVDRELADEMHVQPV